MLALAVLALVGFTAVAREVGQKVLGRVWADNGAGVFAVTMAGVLLIVSPVLLGRLVGMGGGPLWLVSTPLSIVGFVVEYWRDNRVRRRAVHAVRATHGCAAAVAARRSPQFFQNLHF